MRVPSAEQVLDLWEGCRTATLPQRAVAMLHVANPELEVSSLDVGARDGLLVELRCQLLGADMEMSIVCPSCADPLTFAVDGQDLLASLDKGQTGPFTAHHEGWRFDFRLPTAQDMSDALAPGRSDLARAMLLERSLIRIEHDGAAVDVNSLPRDVEEAFVRALEDHSPGAEILFHVSCLECGHEWTCEFDITTYLWTEVVQLAHRILGDVHALASAYGWRESDVLAMSAHRRATYVEMLP